MPVPVPPLDEQREVLALLSEQIAGLQAQAEAVARALAQSTAQRQNLLRAAFAGRLVPQDPADEPAAVLLARIRAERADNATMPKKRGRKAREAA